MPMRRRAKLFAVASLFALSPAARVVGQGDVAQVAGWRQLVAPVLEREAAGMAFFPAEFAGSRATEILDPTGFSVHMVRVDDPGEERVFAAGEPFIPPTGTWRVWLQGDSEMTPFSEIIAFPPPGGWTRVAPRWMSIAPAGHVRIADGGAIEPHLELWLLSAREHGGRLRHELSRRRPVGEVAEGLLMPAGPVLAGAWDDDEERFVALSRPFTVAAEGTTAAPLARPHAEEAWLLSYIERSLESPPNALSAPSVLLGNGDERRADFTVTTTWGAYAVWFGLPPGEAELTGGDTRWYVPKVGATLTGGRIERLDASLVRRPALDVGLVLPRLLREEPFTLSVRTVPDDELLAEEELGRNAGGHRFEGLIHAVLEVELDTHVGSFRRRVDLTDESAGSVTLDPELIEISGTVRRGGEPHPAVLDFRTVAGDLVRAEANEEGEYEAVALRPLRWLTVQLEGVEQEPWREVLAPVVAESRTLDVEVPDAEVRVRVVDSSTREGIAGATVAVRNDYLLPPDPENEERRDARSRERMLGWSHVTDDNGVVHLPPPRPGRIELVASADGYRPGGEPVGFEVPDPPQDREIELLLEPTGAEVQLHLTLPDGVPAAGADVVLVDSLPHGTLLYSGRSDAAGVAAVPADAVRGVLLLKHPAAAAGVVDWQPWANRERVDWRFSPAAGPLTIRAWDPSGREPSAWSYVSLWLGERRLSGAALQRLFDADQRTDGNGLWTARGLPAAALRVLVWSHRLGEEARAGDLDTLAVEIPYPWPATVEVRAVH